MTSLRDRVTKYYQVHSPGKTKGVDDLLSASRFSEAALMAALAAKYGSEISHDRSVPPTRGNLVSYHFTSDQKGQDPLASDAEGKEDAEKRDKKPTETRQQQLEGGAVLSQLVLQHLDCLGLPSVADAFRAELRSYSFPQQFYLREASPIMLPDREATGSALSRLLAPSARTRHQIAVLLNDVQRKIIICDTTLRRDDISLKYLCEMAQAPMWCEAASAPNCYNRPTGEVRAATVNQLVERLTQVSFTPHVSRPEKKVEEGKHFASSVFATHRHFTSSHALLAKLLQRFFVPATLSFSDVFDQHCITISCPTAVSTREIEAAAAKQHISKRTEFWIRISRLIQRKVAAVMVQWISEFAEHFDKVMLESLKVWIEENFYRPLIWSDAPIELIQCAEAIRCKIRMIAETSEQVEMQQPEPSQTASATAAPDPSSATQITPSRVRRENLALLFTRHKTQFQKWGPESPTHEAFSTRVPGEDDMLASDEALMMRSFRPTDAVPAMSVESSGFLHVDELRLANQITAMDHQMFRKLGDHELFIFATSNGVATLHSTNHPAMHLSVFLRRSEELMLCVTTELLRPEGGGGTDRLDSTLNSVADVLGGDSCSASRIKLFEKFVSLAFRLIDMNNLHSAFAVLCGLSHPAIARLSLLQCLPHSVAAGFDELKSLFNCERGYQGYKQYLSTIPDDDVYPAIPVVRIWIDEIRLLCNMEPTVLRDNNGRGLVHWRKFNVLSSIYANLQKRQQALIPAEFRVYTECIQWLNERFANAVHDPQKLLKMSLQIEPKR